jgi:NDP-sugar pyrophosphorylase family protein
VTDYGFIMAGGKGQRLRPLTGAIPKPLLPIGEKPIIELIIEHMKKHNIKDIFVSVNYKKEIIKNFLRDGKGYGVNISYIEENQPLGTAGSLNLLPDEIEGRFIVTNADLICDIDYKKLLVMLNDNDMVITGIKQKVAVDLGVLNVNGNSELISWQEKPEFEYIVNGGIYSIKSNTVEFIKKNTEKNKYIDMPVIWDLMMKNSMKIGVYLHDGEWNDVGKIEDYMSLVENKEENN